MIFLGDTKVQQDQSHFRFIVLRYQCHLVVAYISTTKPISINYPRPLI